MRHRLHASAAALIATSAPVLSLASSARADDPTTVDCLSANESSIKLRADHKLRDARAQLLTCAAASCPAEIRNACSRRMMDVNAAIPTIVFDAKDAAGNDLTVVKVAMDGRPLLQTLEGLAISLDPGPHKFTFETPGQPPVEKTIVLQEAEKGRHVLISFGAPPSPPAPPEVPVAPPSSPPAPSTSTTPPAPVPPPAPVSEATTPTPSTNVSATNEPVPIHGGMGTAKVFGLVLGGVGVAGVAAGSVFGILASSASSEQKSDCAAPTNCLNHGKALSDHSTMTTDATISNVGFIAGGALLATGVVLFIVGGKGSSEQPPSGLVFSPSVGPGGGGVSICGGF